MIKVLRYVAVNPSIAHFDTWDTIMLHIGVANREALGTLLRQIAGVGAGLVDCYGDRNSQKAVRSPPTNPLRTFSKHPRLLLHPSSTKT